MSDEVLQLSSARSHMV